MRRSVDARVTVLESQLANAVAVREFVREVLDIFRSLDPEAADRAKEALDSVSMANHTALISIFLDAVGQLASENRKRFMERLSKRRGRGSDKD